MKKLLAITLSIIFVFSLCACGNKETEKINYSSFTSNNSKENNTIASDLEIAQELADEFTLERGTGFGKKLEDAWKNDPDNEELSAMYHYYNAKFYDDIGQTDNAKNEMKNISPNYSGVMHDEIINYGKSLLGSMWTNEHEEKVEHKEKISDGKRIEIKNWITQRYDYYDKLEGRYCGDKYTKTIFNEAATKFGFTYEEINNIWSDLPI